MTARAAILSRIQARLGITALRRGTEEQLQELFRIAANHEERVRRIERAAAVTAWVEQATLHTAPLVSVMMPTRNRAELLPRAIESVQEQAYPNWELVIVDDGSTDDTPEVLARLGDERIRSLRIEQSGAGVARNRALEEIRGELIAYLDDDNAMHPLWLKAVVWAFEARPDVDVLYGGWLIDDPARLKGTDAGEMPEIWFTPWDPELLLEQPLADQSAIAHRARLAEMRFDEDLKGYHDWLLLARLTVDRQPLVLPAIAHFYGTGGRERLSAAADDEHWRVRARERVREIQMASAGQG
jgi:glycosyltransferase involved in cell wall biosynthesis